MRTFALLAAFAAFGLSACTMSIAPRPELVAAGLSQPVVQGAAVIVMDRDFQNQTITSSPTSLTGAATKLVVPIGPIVRMTGEKVLGAGFSDGVRIGEKAETAKYGVTLRLDEFSYKYDQLSNMGFAVTPKATVSLTAEASDAAGRQLFRKTYAQRDVAADSYMMSSKPQEKVNESLHRALGAIFRQILDDVVAARSSVAAR